MHRSILAAVLVLTAVGCAATADETATSSAGDTAAPVAPLVTQAPTTKGTVLANASGLSLYTFDPDTTSDSTCYNGCATAWPALLVGATDIVSAPFGTSIRHDNTKQLTLNGHPLYTYKGDAAKGDIKGDGLGGVWHLAKPASHVLTQTMVTDAGEVLGNAKGLSLYTFDPDTTSASTCYDGCAVAWPPALVTAADLVEAPFATSVRTDGTLQLTQNGHPLYTYKGDTAVGDIKGDGLGGVWHLAKP